MNNERRTLPAVGDTHFKADPNNKNLVLVTARGHFDVSSVESLRQNLTRSPLFLNPERRVLIEILENCEGTCAYYEALSCQLHHMQSMGFSAKKVAFAISSDVVGRAEGIKNYRLIYTANKFTVDFFQNADDAKAWLLGSPTKPSRPTERIPSKFRTDSVYEHLVRIDCHSPFDAEFCASSIATQASNIQFLNPKRVELISFIGDCSTATDDFYEMFGQHIAREVSMGFAPVSTAIMVPNGSDGRDLLVERLTAVFDKHATYDVRCFSDEKDAEAWLLSDS
jgi:hypothetical protein